MWRDIKGFEGRYQVSASGEVRNFKKGNLLKDRSDKDGYRIVTLGRKTLGLTPTRKVHRLVAEAFITNPVGKPQVNHLNGVRSDNHVANLEWATYSENHTHAYQTLGRANGRDRAIVGVAGDKQIAFPSVMHAHRAGFNRKGIHHCLAGVYAQHKGYVWGYANV